MTEGGVDAAALDRQDDLSSFRGRFVIPNDTVYMDGNSLGRLPTETGPRIHQVVYEQWAEKLVVGWDSWLGEAARIGDKLSTLIGAQNGEVVISDQTSINVYKLASAALAATGRPNIITDRGNFPSDRYVLSSVAEASGGQLILADEDPTAETIDALLDDSVGLVSLSHVSFRSGAMLDGGAITETAHRHGAMVLWDLAHSVGSAPVHLSEWNADLAVGCTYKYLNAGPGAPGFLYVRSDLHPTLFQPIRGWFGHADQFGFAQDWQPAEDIRRFLVGTPGVISMVGVDVGIDLTLEAGMTNLRRKSVALTSLFMDLVRPLQSHGVEIVTPTDPASRGSHVTVAHEHGFQIASELRSRGVIPDFREPDLIRFGFAPLYTTFVETERAADELSDIVGSRSYLEFDSKRRGVT